MTNIHAEDPFEAEVRAAFRSRLDSLDPLIPAKLRHPVPEVQVVAGPVAARRVRSGRSPSSRGLALAALAAAIVLTAGLVGPAFLLRSTGTATGSPMASADVSGRPSDAAILDAHVVASFGSDQLTAAVTGSDGAAYVLDATDQTVYRVDLQTGAKLAVYRPEALAPVGGSSRGIPHLLAAAGQDVLILDEQNDLYRWRPAQGDTTGRGALVQVNIPDSSTWGSNVRAIGTSAANPQTGEYDIYVVDPTANQVLKYPPALDGSGYPREGRSQYLAVQQELSSASDVYVDMGLMLADGGKITRYRSGQPITAPSTIPYGYSPATTPDFTRLAADPTTQEQGGNYYAFDRANAQVVAFSKADGSFVESYRSATGFGDVRAMFLASTADGSANLGWIDGGRLMTAPMRLPISVATNSPEAGTSSPSSSASAATDAPGPNDPRVVASFGTDELTAAVLGPDRAAYVIDGTDSTVYRVDLGSGEKLAIAVSGPSLPAASRIGIPRLLAAGSQELFIVDANNDVWRWWSSPADWSGRSSLSRVPIEVLPGLARADDPRAICIATTYQPVAQDWIWPPSEAYVAWSGGIQVFDYVPSQTVTPPKWSLARNLTLPDDAGPIDQLYAASLSDGIFIVQGGQVMLYANGASRPWPPSLPVRAAAETPYYTRVTGDGFQVTFSYRFAYDQANKQVSVFGASDNTFVTAYRWSALGNLRDMFVITTRSRTLYWIADGNLMRAVLPLPMPLPQTGG